MHSQEKRVLREIGASDNERSKTTLEPNTDVLDIEEAAAFLRVSKHTVYDLARAKKIPGKKIGPAVEIFARHVGKVSGCARRSPGQHKSDAQR
jgi:excisionase family DNA binding protein